MHYLSVATRMWRTAVQLGVGPLLAGSAVGKEPEITATMIPHADWRPRHRRPAASATRLVVSVNAIQDLWKRDALTRDPPLYLNADRVVIERGQFQAEVESFGDPHGPAAPEYEIRGIGMCLSGHALYDNAGLHNC
ncbi:MAG: hypothetical protein JWM91_1006 [Rhodospirillales bacterium]|nr:hypothetical protein [Rhodospirillales bacterium]